MQPITKPFLPSDLRRPPPHQALIRAAVATVLSKFNRMLPLEVAKARWPQDRDTELILRAAVSPATIPTSGWASTLAETSVADFLMGMGPASAGSMLLRRGMQLQF